MVGTQDPKQEPHNIDEQFAKQAEVGEFRKILENMLWETDNPDRIEAVNVPATTEQLYSYLYRISLDEYFGEPDDPVRGFCLTSVTVSDSVIVSGIYLLAEQGGFEPRPVKLIFMESNKSAVVIIPIQISNDLLSVKIAPLITSKAPQDDTLRAIYKLWSENRSLLDKKIPQRKTFEDLLRDPRIKRGSDI